MTSRNWLMQATDLLTALGAPDPRLDAEWMLSDALGVGRGELRLRLEQPLTERQTNTLNQWLAERASGEPLQYAQRRAYFMGLELYVDHRVLIPRPDTEILCERALEIIRPGMDVLDLCTGSGALAVAIAKRCPGASVCASDVSCEALRVARLNAARHRAKIEFFQGDLLAAVPGRTFDAIVCNPPYIRDGEMGALQSEVLREPELALRGGTDGLDFYRRIADTHLAHLNPGGSLLLEVGQGQARDVAGMFEGQIQIVPDLSSIERVVVVTRTV